MRAVPADGDSRLPVWLVKVDVEPSSPVCEHHLLRDEAMVTSTSAPFMRQIHGALGGPGGLIVMVGHGGMGGGSTVHERKGRDEHEKHESKSTREGCGHILGIIMAVQGRKDASHSRDRKKEKRTSEESHVHYSPSSSAVDHESHFSLFKLTLCCHLL